MAVGFGVAFKAADYVEQLRKPLFGQCIAGGSRAHARASQNINWCVFGQVLLNLRDKIIIVLAV